MSPKSILLVENDENLRQSIALILQRAGYRVSATDCANPALEILKSKVYHLLITDVNSLETNKVLMPRIIEFFPHLPLVILTDRPFTEAEAVNWQSRAHYLIKPVEPERLLASVHTLLGNHSVAPVPDQVLFEDPL